MNLVIKNTHFPFARHALNDVATFPFKGAAPILWPHSAAMERSALRLVPCHGLYGTSPRFLAVFCVSGTQHPPLTN